MIGTGGFLLGLTPEEDTIDFSSLQKRENTCCILASHKELSLISSDQDSVRFSESMRSS